MNLGDHPALMVLAITAAATFLSAIPIGIRIPIVVWEILFGALLGPHLLGLARDLQGPLWNWFSLAGLGACFSWPAWS
jgi:Kef-type K+ transport system membrane component KefB